MGRTNASIACASSAAHHHGFTPWLVEVQGQILGLAYRPLHHGGKRKDLIVQRDTTGVVEVTGWDHDLSCSHISRHPFRNGLMAL